MILKIISIVTLLNASEQHNIPNDSDLYKDQIEQLESVVRKGIRWTIYGNQDLISRSLRLKGEHEPRILKVILNRLEDQSGNFLDIGGHIGTMCIPPAKKYPKRKFYAIEANPTSYNILLKNMFQNHIKNLRVLNIAVGNPQSETCLSLRPFNLISEENTGGYCLKKQKTSPNEKGYKVKFCKIDDLSFEALSIIKIDVEGMELDVLKGSQETLHHHGYPDIIFECWSEENFREEKQKLFDFIESQGYYIFVVNISNYMAIHREKISFSQKLKHMFYRTRNKIKNIRTFPAWE